MDPTKIDVNVHPTKLEIRFQEEQKVFKAVYHAIRDSLLKNELVRDVEKTDYNNTEPIKTNMIVPQTPAPLSSIEKKTNDLMENKKQETGLFSLFKKRNENEEVIEQSENVLAEIFSKKNAINSIPEEKIEHEEIKNEETEERKEKQEEPKIEEPKKETASIDVQPKENNFDEMYSKTFGIEIKKEDSKKENNVPKFENITVFEEEEKYEQIPAYKYCGTVFSTYLVIEINNEMYMIDQHAAHERIMYEKVKKNYYNESTTDSQILLLPDIINLTNKEKSIVQENINMFEKAGFIIEEFGDSTIRLIGVPSDCVELDTKELFLEILDAVNTVAITALQEKEDKFLATIACKAAVKAGQELKLTEVKELLDTLLKLPNPFTCPHGRPTAIKMSKYDIERKFNRK